MDNNLIQRRRAQTLRKSATKEENHLWYDFLKTYPVQFRRQYPVGNYYADFCCYRAKLIVELDGSQHYMPQTEEYDQTRTAYLQEQGFLVLRFSNADIWKNFEGICQTIDTKVKRRL